MRCLLLALLFVFSSSLISIANNENIKEWTQKYSGFASNESFSLEDSSKILHYKNKGTWEDTMGNFGTQTCFGLVLLEKNNNIISMEIYCEAQDQDNDKFYTKVTRDSSLDAGVGEYVLIDGSGKWKSMIKSKCKYAVKYKEKALFVNSKCRVAS